MSRANPNTEQNRNRDATVRVSHDAGRIGGDGAES